MGKRREEREMKGGPRNVQTRSRQLLTPKLILGPPSTAVVEDDSLKVAVNNMLYQEHQTAVNKMKRPANRGRNALYFNIDRA